MAINRVQVIWAGDPTSGGGLSTFYFNAAVGTPAQQVAAVGTLLTATNDRRAATCSWATDADVATIDEVSGNITALTGTTPATGVGTAVGDALPPIAQGLLRLFGAMIVGGRLLRGRLFLPGAVESDNASTGGTSTTYRSDYEAAALALINDANTEWRIWSRTHGVSGDVVSATVWTKFASLRSRRD